MAEFKTGIRFEQESINIINIYMEPVSEWAIGYRIVVTPLNGSTSESYYYNVGARENDPSGEIKIIEYYEDIEITIYCDGYNISNGDEESIEISETFESNWSTLPIGATFNDDTFIYKVVSETSVIIVGHYFDDGVIEAATIPAYVKKESQEYKVIGIDEDYCFFDSIQFLELRISGGTYIDSSIQVSTLYIDGNIPDEMGVGTTAPTVYIENAESIGRGAFKENPYVRNIYVPNTVTKIGENAFDVRHDNLTIHYDGTKAQWDAIAKEYYVGISNVSIVFKGPNYNIKVKIDNNLRNITNIFYKQNGMLKSIKNFIHK